MGYQPPNQPPYQPNQQPPFQQGYPQQPPFQQGYPQQPPFQQGYQQPPFQQGYQQQGKDWLITLLLCIFVGVFGVHRFYVGKIGTGVAMLLTFGGCGIWLLVDFILILTGSFNDANGQPLVRNN